MRMLALAILTTLIGLPGAGAQQVARATSPASNQHEFEFAKGRVGKFELNASTQINWRDDAPFIGETSCYASNSDISFVVGNAAQIQWITFGFYGPPDHAGDRSQITLTGDRLWLFVDGRRYEYRNVPRLSDRFSNYPYPRAPDGSDAIILPIWHGYRAIRASATEPFMNMSVIYGDILRAKTLAWGFKSRDWKQVDRSVPENNLPRGWQRRRYRIDNEDLSAAVEWCARAVTSDAARRLPSARN
jgi:hypothetical protein